MAAMLDRMRTEGNPGTPLDAAHVELWLLKAAYAVVPNFQAFWLSDAVQQKRAITFDYVLPTVAYGAAMVVATVCVATALFQRREL